LAQWRSIWVHPPVGASDQETISAVGSQPWSSTLAKASVNNQRLGGRHVGDGHTWRVVKVPTWCGRGGAAANNRAILLRERGVVEGGGGRTQAVGGVRAQEIRGSESSVGIWTGYSHRGPGAAGGAAEGISQGGGRGGRRVAGMGVGSDDAVVIQLGKKAGEASVITVNCPDKTGLGCDLCRIILEFGLCISRADTDLFLSSLVAHIMKDLSTDGKWCYVVFWVVPSSDIRSAQWANLKSRLLSACPSPLFSFYYDAGAARSVASQVYLLKVLCVDRKGLLHDVTQILCELDIIIQRVKVSTTPNGRVVDLFFITDGMELLHTKQRREETCARLNAVLGESCEPCEIQLAGPEYEIFQQGCSSLPPAVAEKLFSPEPSDDEFRSETLSPDLTKLKKSCVTLDNSLSPAHTLLQIHCVDQKGLLYDIMRTLKDCNIQIAYGRLLSDTKSYRDVDLFVLQSDGKKIVDPEKQESLCSRLRTEMLHPLRVMIANRGPDTELLVANPVELSGKGRPRVFYDVTLALKLLGTCIFSAEIGRYTAGERQWEVYRFLLDETPQLPLSNSRARARIVDRVRRTLMGWS
ncbi:hypothetical protein Taro_007111, partial [Colocasia esculenta]|nr:hypothetical protein [Colocasia esculenta]